MNRELPIITLSRVGDRWVADFRHAADHLSASGRSCVRSIFPADMSAADVQAYYRRYFPGHLVGLRLRDALELPREMFDQIDTDSIERGQR